MNLLKSTQCLLVMFVTAKVCASDDAISEYMIRLRSVDHSAQADGISYFENVIAKNGIALPTNLVWGDVEPVLQRGVDCGDAARLAGRLGDRRCIPLLLETQARCEQEMLQADINEGSLRRVRRVHGGCLGALLRLGHTQSVVQVQAMLQSSNLLDRVEGVESVVYARNQSLVPELLRLLEDKRDAVHAGLSGSPYFIRICDLALNAAAEMRGLNTSFERRANLRYSDAHIHEVDLILKEALHGGRPKTPVKGGSK